MLCRSEERYTSGDNGLVRFLMQSLHEGQALA